MADAHGGGNDAVLGEDAGGGGRAADEQRQVEAVGVGAQAGVDAGETVAAGEVPILHRRNSRARRGCKASIPRLTTGGAAASLVRNSLLRFRVRCSVEGERSWPKISRPRCWGAAGVLVALISAALIPVAHGHALRRDFERARPELPARLRGAAGLREFAPLRPLNVDLSTLTAATDVALAHGDPPDRIIDVNFQSGPDEGLDGRALLYNAVLHHRYGVPVHTILVLLRPTADHVRLTGKLRYEGRKRKGRMEFTYEVVRLWRQPLRRYLEGGLGTLPLAPLCRLPAAATVEEALAPVIRKVADRLRREATPEDRAKLLTATYVLTGLRVTEEVSERLFQGVQNMLESSTYRKILRDGRNEGLAEGQVLLRVGRQRFGAAPKGVKRTLTAVKDIGRLERMTERLLAVADWQELLDTP